MEQPRLFIYHILNRQAGLDLSLAFVANGFKGLCRVDKDKAFFLSGCTMARLC